MVDTRINTIWGRSFMTSILSSRYLKPAMVSGVLIGCVTIPAVADDIDVYTAQVGNNAKPNILFVLDYSGSMKDDFMGNTPTPGNPARIDLLKDAMNTVLNDNLNAINAGLGSLYSRTATGIQWPISELTADASSVDPAIAPGTQTVKDVIEQRVNNMDAQGRTATVDALVEAAQYFKGGKVTPYDVTENSFGGTAPDPVTNPAAPATWNPVSEQYEGGSGYGSIATSYSPSDAYATDWTQTYYCNDFSQSGGPNHCENKTLSNCQTMAASSAPVAGYDSRNNLWGDYLSCEYTRNSNWAGAYYDSPVTQSCQANAIVLISDGKPTRVTDSRALQSVIGGNLSGCEDLSNSIFGEADGGHIFGNCGPEITRLLANSDINSAIPGSNVNTYTIGFNTDDANQAYLNTLAKAGGGSFFDVDQPEKLTQALNEIIEDVLGGSENFAELSIDVDKASFSHDNRAFFSLFTPSTHRSWEGNLKGYFVDNEGLKDINGNKATNVTALGEQFADEAQSFWSDSIDGNDVVSGGAAEQLIGATRNLYTYTNGAIPSTGLALSGNANTRLDRNNNQITYNLLNLPGGSALREVALDWIHTAPMGDPLHSKSVSLNYGNRQVVYIMTNQGLLHAIDATNPTVPGSGDSSGGEELFAFMPKRLLSNLPELQANHNSGSHIYGLDGQITRWHTDTNNDGIVNNSEEVLLVFGMRRGGNAYFALDVSNPLQPRLEWVIDSSNPDFSQLAQSWSRMSLINVKQGNNTRRVLAFAGGYDATNQDNVNGRVSASGNAIYMVDERGRLVWSVDQSDHPNMQFSIASDLTTIDSDQDGLADRLYVGDVGGQLWRVDFEDIDTTPAVTLMADLDNGKHQPFFYPPSVAYNQGIGGDFLSISIGSGNRTSPLLTDTDNALFMIRDTNIEKGAPATHISTIDQSDLYDATSNSIGSSDTMISDAAASSLAAASGWFVSLGNSEKALSRLVTFEGKLLATTFEANTSAASLLQCNFDSTGRFYLMSVVDAQPETNLHTSGPTDSSTITRFTELNSSYIPSSPVIVFPKGSGQVQVIVDKEVVNLIDQQLSRVYWHAK